MPVFWLGEPACDDVRRVGGKAANLSRLFRQARVPDGFCLVLDEDELAGLDSDVPPPSVREQLAVAYRELGERSGTDEVPVAVRSSAVDEDAADASFAGQHETFLNVSGADKVAEAVADCWASARTERALQYRRSRGLDPPHGPIPVLVQALVTADASAVVFSVDPVTGARDHVVINASWGLGESVVAGAVNPDTLHVRRSDLSVTRRELGTKRQMTVAIPGGTLDVEVPFALRDQPSVDDEQAAEMAGAALALEDHFGWPVDVECCWAGGQLCILQCRAVTALAMREERTSNGN